MEKFKLIAEARAVLYGGPVDIEAAKKEFWKRDAVLQRRASRDASITLLQQQARALRESLSEGEHEGGNAARSIIVRQLMEELNEFLRDGLALSFINSGADNVADLMADMMAKLAEDSQLIRRSALWCTRGAVAHLDSSSVKNGSVAGGEA